MLVADAQETPDLVFDSYFVNGTSVEHMLSSPGYSEILRLDLRIETGSGTLFKHSESEVEPWPVRHLSVLFDPDSKPGLTEEAHYFYEWLRSHHMNGNMQPLETLTIPAEMAALLDQPGSRPRLSPGGENPPPVPPTPSPSVSWRDFASHINLVPI